MNKQLEGKIESESERIESVIKTVSHSTDESFMDDATFRKAVVLAVLEVAKQVAFVTEMVLAVDVQGGSVEE